MTRLKKKNDADVEWLLGEVNTAHYEGQTNHRTTNTLEGRSKSAILIGSDIGEFSAEKNYRPYRF